MNHALHNNSTTSLGKVCMSHYECGQPPSHLLPDMDCDLHDADTYTVTRLPLNPKIMTLHALIMTRVRIRTSARVSLFGT